MTSSFYTGINGYIIVVKLENDLKRFDQLTKTCEEADELFSLTLCSVLAGVDFIEITFNCTADISYVKRIQEELEKLPGVTGLRVRPNTGSIGSFYYRKRLLVVSLKKGRVFTHPLQLQFILLYKDPVPE